MRYFLDAALLSPVWAGAIFLFASRTNAPPFSQEWLDLAALFSVYTLAGSIVAILIVRLLLWLSQQSYRHG